MENKNYSAKRLSASKEFLRRGLRLAMRPTTSAKRLSASKEFLPSKWQIK